MPRAIGRSKRPDSLGRSAGARLTVMRLLGNSKPELTMAARTRSRASLTSVSGRPTSASWQAAGEMGLDDDRRRIQAIQSATVGDGQRHAAGLLARAGFFQRVDAGFQGLQLSRCGQNLSLNVELLAGDQVELAEKPLSMALAFFDIAGRVLASRALILAPKSSSILGSSMVSSVVAGV